MKKHQIRIVGGIYKRTLISVIENDYLRPTPDRVRETLFNWLGHFWDNRFDDKRVLDLFAGSGALGFEAASRGIQLVDLIDNNPKAIEGIKAVKQRIKANNVEIFRQEAISYLESRTSPEYDLVLLDPPFGMDWPSRIIPMLDRVLQNNGLIYLETEIQQNQLPENWQLLRQAKAGKVQYCLIRFAAMQKNSNNIN